MFLLLCLNSIMFDTNSLLILVLLICSTMATCVCAIMICYKNILWFAIKRLMWQLNCAMVFGAGMCIFAIECVVPRTPYTCINAFIYWLLCTLFICLDALKVKSRTFMIAVAFIFIVTTVYAIFDVSYLPRTRRCSFWCLFSAPVATIFAVQTLRSVWVTALLRQGSKGNNIWNIYRETGTGQHVKTDDFRGDEKD